MISENGYFFTDINEPTPQEKSFGDLNPPGSPETTPPDPGVTTIEDGKVVMYEDDEIIMNYFVYADDKLVSYLETNKVTGNMIQYTFTRTAGPPLEAVGSNEDYQNFGTSGLVDSLSDDVPNSSIENYTVTETPIASIGPGGVLIPA